MKQKVDYLLIGTGVAPLIAALKLTHRGDRVVVLNPDPDFFLENSELPLDLLHFETTQSDLHRRFSNNTPEKMYQNLISEFPGAIEIHKEEDARNQNPVYQVEGAPWIRARHRMWVAQDKGPSRDRLENLYLTALDRGWKPQWLEGVYLAKRFPGFSARGSDERNLDSWIGFMGPRLGDVDVTRYRMGLLEYARERLGREEVIVNASVLDCDSRGVRIRRSQGLPENIEVNRGVIYFWTPKLERTIQNQIETFHPRALPQFQSSAVMQSWEEWDLLSRDPVNPYVVAHLDGLRIWAHGEGCPPPRGFNRIKVMRRSKTGDLMGEFAFQELSKLIFQFMGWDRFTVRGMSPRNFYRWNQMSPIEFDSNGIRTLVIPACDGPLHWIANQVRLAVDGI